MAMDQGLPRSRLNYEEARLEYTENTIDFGELEPVVNELAEDFMLVRVTRRWAGPMATPLFGDVAIAFILGASASGFLSALGKDVYHGLRGGLFSLYQKARRFANGRGYAPFAIENMIEEPSSAYNFVFPDGLSKEEFEDAILSIAEAIDQVEADAKLVGFEYIDGEWQARRIQ